MSPRARQSSPSTSDSPSLAEAPPPTEAPHPRRRAIGYASTLGAVLALGVGLHLRTDFSHHGGHVTGISWALIGGAVALFVLGFRSLKDVPVSAREVDEPEPS